MVSEKVSPFIFMDLKIKILKNTPFDKEGNVISFDNFKQKYGYISNNCTDKEIIRFLLTERNLYLSMNDKNSGNYTGSYFEVQLYVDSLPDRFMYENELYTKRSDDSFYTYSENVKVVITKNEALLIINTSKREHFDIPVYRD